MYATEKSIGIPLNIYNIYRSNLMPFDMGKNGNKDENI